MIVQLKLDNKPEIGDMLIVEPLKDFSLTCIENNIDYKFSVGGKFKDEYIKPERILYKVASVFKNIPLINFSEGILQFKILK